MAEVDSSKLPSLSEQYLLKEKEQEPEMAAKPLEESEVKPTISAPDEEIDQKTEENPIVADTEVGAAAAEVVAAASESAAGESNESSHANEPTEDIISAPTEESSVGAEPESAEAEDTPEIKIETAPADFRFPTTNQSRHCFTRYIEYHRCIAAKGESAPECDKFAKYYRSLCPGEWVDRWNEQRENGTFPGPL